MYESGTAHLSLSILCLYYLLLEAQKLNDKIKVVVVVVKLNSGTNTPYYTIVLINKNSSRTMM